MKKVIFLFLVLLNVGNNAYADETQQCMDFITGKVLDYTDGHFELKDSKYNFYDDISIRYPQFKLPANKAVESKTNKRIKEIFIDQISTEQFKIGLYADMETRLKTLYQSQRVRSDYYGDKYDKRLKLNPEIEHVHYSFLNYSGNTITMLAQFSYKVKTGENSYYKEFTYNQVYYFDLNNGKEYHPEDVFKKSSKAVVSKLITEKLRGISFKKTSDRDVDEGYNSDNYNDATEGEMYEETDDGEVIAEKKADDLEIVNDGFPYFKGYTLAFCITSFNRGLKQFKSTEIEIRFTLDEIKPYINSDGPYAHLLTMKEPHQGKHHNLNAPLFIRPGDFFGFDFTLNYYRSDYASSLFESEMPLHCPDKSIVEMKFYSLDKNKKDTTVTKMIFKKMRYNENGLLTEVDLYDYSFRPSAKYLFEYNALGSLVAYTSSNAAQKIENKIKLQYDENNNLISITELDSAAKIIKGTYCYYTDSFCLKEAYNLGSFNSYITISRMDIDAQSRPAAWYRMVENNFMPIYCHYDENGNILSIYSKNENFKEYNSHTYINNRLVAEERDFDRHITSYTYDKNGNMIEMNRYDGLIWQGGSKFEYNERKMPISIKRLVNYKYFDTSNVNKSFVDYEYRK